MTLGNIQHAVLDEQSVRPPVIARDRFDRGRAMRLPYHAWSVSPFGPVDVAETAKHGRRSRSDGRPAAAAGPIIRQTGIFVFTLQYINFREREMNKNTSRKMHTLWSTDSQEN